MKHIPSFAATAHTGKNAIVSLAGLLIISFLLMHYISNTYDATASALPGIYINYTTSGRMLILLQSPFHLSIRTPKSKKLPEMVVNKKSGKGKVNGTTACTKEDIECNVGAPAESKTNQNISGRPAAISDEVRRYINNYGEAKRRLRFGFSRLMRITIMLLLAVLIM